MLKAQNGKRYEGGTAVGNHAMVRLFERHGCERYRHEIGLRWRAPA